MKREAAEQTNTLLLDCYARLADSAEPVKPELTPDEWLAYRRLLANALADLLDMLNMIHKKYPDLKPSDWR